MRVIAGEFRSRKLASLPGPHVRPTPDRLRESLFNVVVPRIAGTTFLDAYAGSGAVGIEALSRGASRLILIERRADAIAIIRQNLRTLKIEDRATIVRGLASVLLPNHPADIAFLDPPYDLAAEYRDSLVTLANTSCWLAIAQHASIMPLDDRYGAFTKTRVLKQGANSLSFFERVTDLRAVSAKEAG